MTAKRKHGNSVMRLERVPNLLVDYSRVHHVAGGPYAGILINKSGTDLENTEPPDCRLEFLAFIKNDETQADLLQQDLWLLRFWFQGGLDGLGRKKTFVEYFHDLMDPIEFPDNYIGFVKRALIVLRKHTKIRRVELEVQQIEIGHADQELPPIKSFVTVYTPSTFIYQFVPEVNIEHKTFLTFKVKTGGNAHIALCARQGDVRTDAFEIVIGTDNNTKSLLREGSQGYVRAESITYNVLSSRNYRYFWLSWANDRLEVGRGAEYGLARFLSYDVPWQSRFDVSCFAVATSKVSKGVWEFAELIFDIPEHLSWPGRNGRHQRAEPDTETLEIPLEDFEKLDILPGSDVLARDGMVEVRARTPDLYSDSGLQNDREWLRRSTPSLSSRELGITRVILRPERRNNMGDLKHRRAISMNLEDKSFSRDIYVSDYRQIERKDATREGARPRRARPASMTRFDLSPTMYRYDSSKSIASSMSDHSQSSTQSKKHDKQYTDKKLLKNAKLQKPDTKYTAIERTSPSIIKRRVNDNTAMYRGSPTSPCLRRVDTSASLSSDTSSLSGGILHKSRDSIDASISSGGRNDGTNDERNERKDRARLSLLWLGKRERLLRVIEGVYPNSIALDVLLRQCQLKPGDAMAVKVVLDDLDRRSLIKRSEGDRWIRQPDGFTRITHIIKMSDGAQVRETDQPTIAVITCLYCEMLAVEAMLDNKRTYVKHRTEGGSQMYTVGDIGPLHVVTTKLSRATDRPSESDERSDETTVTRLLGTFTAVEHVILVGVGGAVPQLGDYRRHVRLGDVVVALPSDSSGAQYVNAENVERIGDGFSYTTRVYGCMDATLLRSVETLKRREESKNHSSWRGYIDRGMQLLRDNHFNFTRPPAKSDRVYKTNSDSSYTLHEHPNPIGPDVYSYRAETVRVRYGAVGCGRLVSRCEPIRDEFANLNRIKCYDAEFGAVLQSLEDNCNDSFLVVRGMADYVDGTQGTLWQPYAALVAAAYMKAVIIGIS